jgi:hypothetical protein
MKYSGIFIGFIFCVGSILLYFSLIGPLFLLFISEPIGSAINSIFELENISGTTFYSSVGFCALSLSVYLFILLKKPKHSARMLIFLFTIILIFFNSALFYFDIRKPNAHVDGQQIFGIIDKPLKTCLIYPIIGILHDFYLSISNKKQQVSK